MKRSIIQVMKLSFFCICLVAFTNVSAQNTYALIVGISQYKEMPALQYADRDAIAFAEFVKGQGAAEEQVKVFLNEEATRLNIVDELYNLSKKTKAGDRFYFYFGGHGDLEAQIAYHNSLLLLHGSLRKNYFQGQEFLQLSELRTWLGTLAQKKVQVVFIADACHSGGLIGGKEGLSKTQQALQESWAGITKILSSQSNEYSLEGKQWGGGRGLFSFHLVNGLKGKADANKNKLVSLGELEQYLKTNVVKEAAPNVQTPLIQGDFKALLAKVNELELKKLLDAERLGFPIITEANFKANIEDLLVELDSSLVGTYKKFSKALKEKRLAPHDDSIDFAVIHFKKLATQKIPDHLLQLMKRNLAAALMERELSLLQNVREKGQGFIPRNAKTLLPAIYNLEETMKILGSQHYLFIYLQARKLVLEAALPLKADFKMQIDEMLNASRENTRQGKEILLKSLQLEPNMVSTYTLLSTHYRVLGKADSAIYYQEKGLDLLPNQALAFLAASTNYLLVDQKTPHPKMIEYLERAVQLDSNLIEAHRSLADLYSGRGTSFHNYPKAIYSYKKVLDFYQKSDDELLRLGLHKVPNKDEIFRTNQSQTSFNLQLIYLSELYFVYKKKGDSLNAEAYWNKLQRTVTLIGSVHAYMVAGSIIFNLFEWTEDDFYLNQALGLFQSAVKKAEEDLGLVSSVDKPFHRLRHRELLKAVGLTQLALKNYAEAEKILLQTLAYSIDDFPGKDRLKLLGSYVQIFSTRVLLTPKITINGGADYTYRMEANIGMFLSKLDQNKPEEALEWYEKALLVSVAEYGNDVSGNPFTETILEVYKNLNKEKFLALRHKYFPETTKK